jgi:hypothetical protein
MESLPIEAWGGAGGSSLTSGLCPVPNVCAQYRGYQLLKGPEVGAVEARRARPVEPQANPDGRR